MSSHRAFLFVRRETIALWFLFKNFSFNVKRSIIEQFVKKKNVPLQIFFFDIKMPGMTKIIVKKADKTNKLMCSVKNAPVTSKVIS